MTNKPNDVRVSRELLEELLDAAKWKAADFTKASPYRSKIDEVVRRTKDLLTQPADQQAEPVAITELRHIFDCNKGADRTLVISKKLAAQLLADQPATAKLVLPERMPGITHTDSHEEGWNACIDEVAKLNANHP